MIDLLRLLNIYDVKDLSAAYTQAYLQSSPGRRKPRRDFGAFEEGRLIRTEDNSIFAFLTCPAIFGVQDAIYRQALGSNIQDYFVHILAHFILNGYRTLPCDKIKIAFAINHSSAHWSLMHVEFNHIDVAGYERLYRAYNALKPKERQLDATTNRQTSKMNQIRNYIMRKQGVRLHRRTKRGVLSSNGRLPLHVESLQITNYDSMGTDRTFTIRDASQFIIQNHNVIIKQGNCARQSGNTCGDWTVYNAFTKAVLTKKIAPPSSSRLRYLQNNLSLDNAKKVLQGSAKDLTACTEAERICVTKEERALAEVDAGPILFAYNAATTVLNSVLAAVNFINPFKTQVQPELQKRHHLK